MESVTDRSPAVTGGLVPSRASARQAMNLELYLIKYVHTRVSLPVTWLMNRGLTEKRDGTEGLNERRGGG